MQAFMNTFFKSLFLLSKLILFSLFLPAQALLVVENPLKRGKDHKESHSSQSLKVLNVVSYLEENPILFFKVEPDKRETKDLSIRKRVKALLRKKRGISKLFFLSSKKEEEGNSKGEENLLEKVRLFHINASDFSNKSQLIKMMREVKSHNIKISLDLGSIENVKKHKDELLNVLPKYIDILFANEKEILELTHLPASEACDFLSTFCEVVVVTLGYEGSWVKSGQMKFYTPSLKANQIENAKVGTLFIAGFLHGYLSQATLPNCSWIGSFIASKGLGLHDPVADPMFLNQIKSELQKEKNLLPSK